MAKKRDFDSLAAQGAARTPTISDRIAHASAVAQHSPISGASAAQKAPLPGSTLLDNPPVAVDINLIDENPFNARKIYNEDSLLQLSASLATNGQEYPGTATFRDGRYILAAGHRRLRGLKHLQSPTMKLIVLPDLTDQQLYEISFRENKEREEQTALDNALVWTGLLEQGIYATANDLATAIGQTRGNISKALSAAKLSAKVMQAVESSASSFGMTLLYELQLYEQATDADRAQDAALAIIDGTLSRASLQAARAAHESGKTRKETEISRQYKIPLNEGISSGVIKEWDSGRVSLDVRFVDPEMRAKMVRMLREHLLVGD
jgi:ParB family chromosome partitioning protein